jgi:hypothetical protein
MRRVTGTKIRERALPSPFARKLRVLETTETRAFLG